MGAQSGFECGDCGADEKYDRVYVNAAEEYKMRKSTRYEKTEIEENYSTFKMKRKPKSS